MDVRNLSRRGLILGAAASLTAPTVSSAMTPPYSSALAPAPALVELSRDLIAVRVFPTYDTTVYGQHRAVLARLGDLGIKRMSHKLTPAMDAETVQFTRQAFEEHGIRSWFTVGEPRVPLGNAEWERITALLTGPLAGMVERCYGWNEPNHVRGGGAPLSADWARLTGAHQAQLWQRVAPLGIKVGTPQLWSADLDAHDADLAELAPHIANKFDHIGWHLYPRGGVGIELLNRFEATYRNLLGDYQVVCTEAGYFTARSYTGGAEVVTEAQQAALLPQLVQAYASRGYGLSVFELLDDPDPSGAEREAHLGLVRTPSLDPASWTDKPAFGALKALVAVMGSRG